MSRVSSDFDDKDYVNRKSNPTEKNKGNFIDEINEPKKRFKFDINYLIDEIQYNKQKNRLG